MDVSSIAVVGIVLLIFGYGLFKRTDVSDAFCEGAKDGVKTAFELLPTLCYLMLAISMLRASGALEALVRAVSPLTEKIGFPAEVLPLAILRPVSGSGALSLLEDILNRFGADSFVGRTASVLMASTETTFYTVAVYFGAVKAKKPRKALAASLAGDLSAFMLSALAVRLIFG